MKTGVELIAEERQRQLEVEKWSASHDANHTKGELADAAICYAARDYWRNKIRFQDLMIWPFDQKWFKPTPHDRVRELQKAGALIAAEIDRLNLEKGFSSREQEEDSKSTSIREVEEQLKSSFPEDKSSIIDSDVTTAQFAITSYLDHAQTCVSMLGVHGIVRCINFLSFAKHLVVTYPDTSVLVSKDTIEKMSGSFNMR